MPNIGDFERLMAKQELKNNIANKDAEHKKGIWEQFPKLDDFHKKAIDHIRNNEERVNQRLDEAVALKKEADGRLNRPMQEIIPPFVEVMKPLQNHMNHLQNELDENAILVGQRPENPFEDFFHQKQILDAEFEELMWQWRRFNMREKPNVGERFNNANGQYVYTGEKWVSIGNFVDKKEIIHEPVNEDNARISLDKTSNFLALKEINNKYGEGIVTYKSGNLEMDDKLQEEFLALYDKYYDILLEIKE